MTAHVRPRAWRLVAFASLAAGLACLGCGTSGLPASSRVPAARPVPAPGPIDVCDLPAAPDGAPIAVQSQASKPLPALATDLAVPAGRVARVDVAVRGSLSPDLVRGLLVTRAGIELEPATVAADVRRIYALGNFEDVAVEAEAGPEGVTVRFLVEERPLIRTLRVRGVDAPEQARLMGVSRLAQGDLFQASALLDATTAVRDHFLERGHYLAEASARARRVDDAAIDVCLLVEAGPKVTVAALQLDGNQSVATGELLAAMEVESGGPNAPGGTYQKDALERQVLLLNAAYYDRGFIQVAVGEPEIRVSEDRTAMTIRVPIEEGPVFRVGTLSAEGELAASRRVYLGMVRSKPGDVFSRRTMMEDLERIRAYHRAQGHGELGVEPETSIEVEARRVNVILRVARSGATDR